MDVVVEVGGWEHECCGGALERDAVVDLGCLRRVDRDGRVRLLETHHEVEPDERVRGRVTDLHVVTAAGATRPVLRLPGGRALRGVDPHDDGHLEDPWTGEVLTPDGDDFLVTLRTSG